MAGAFILGVDPSLTGTGMAVIDRGRGGELVDSRLVRTKPPTALPERWHTILVELQHLLAAYNPFVVMEAPIIGHASGALEIAGLHGVLLHGIWRGGHPCKLVVGSTLKKFATGKGAGPKSVMIAHVLRRWGVMLEDDNLADAFALAQLGLALVNGDFELPAKKKKKAKAKKQDPKKQEELWQGRATKS